MSDRRIVGVAIGVVVTYVLGWLAFIAALLLLVKWILL